MILQQKKILIAAIVMYIFIVSVLYLAHERIVFQPDTLPRSYQFHFDRPFKEFDMPSGINALHFPVSDTAKGIVLYFHGNADNLQRWGQYTVDFTQHQYEVLAIDYPGYGKSEGKAGEQAFYRSAEQAFYWARDRFPAGQIIIYGRSLGSGPAAWLASQYHVRQLILETPFPSIPQLFRMRGSPVLVPFDPRPKFPVADYLQEVAYPISIFQGTDDWVVPYRVARRLRTVLKPGDHFFTIEGGGHKNLRSFPEYHEKLADVLR